MNCPLLTEENTGLLLDYTAGRLGSGQIFEVELHLRSCPACEAFVASQLEVWTSLEEWQAPAVSQDFNRRVWQRIEADAALPWYRKLGESLRMGSWKPALSLAAAVTVISLGFLFDHRGVAPVNGPALVSAAEADQVERTLDDIQLLHEFDKAVTEDDLDSADQRPM